MARITTDSMQQGRLQRRSRLSDRSSRYAASQIQQP
jgi:hypothetical protein